MQEEEPGLPVEKARLSHWIVHIKDRVAAAMLMHITEETVVAMGKVVFLQDWVDKLDALAADVHERLGCIVDVGAAESATAAEGDEGYVSGSESEHESESGSESEMQS